MRSLLDFASPPPPPPPLLQTLAPPTPSYNPSIIIITATLLFVVIASAAVHFLLRFLSRRSSSSPELPLSSTSSPPSTPSPPPLSAAKDLISTLPLFSLAAALPKTSADCAVCLSAFRPHDELRLLPACRHAFHAACIDTWLRSTSSCPLCRAAVVLPIPPPEAASTSASASSSSSRSGSFRIEIGSISRRQSLPEADRAAAPSDQRSYSVGSSFEYVVEEEVEAFLNSVLRRVPEKERKPEPPPPPQPEAAAAAAAAAALADAVGGASRGWLRDYVDRISSSSFRRSSRSSQPYDDGGGGSVAPDGGGDWGFEAEESGMFSNFARWLWGPHPNT